MIPTNMAAIPGEHYVYHLTLGNEVVYVGFTNNLKARICAHKSRFCGKFDGYVAFLHEDRLSALSAERRDIDAIRPPLNIKMKRLRSLFRIRVDKELKMRLVEAAGRKRMTLSDFVRSGLWRRVSAEEAA